MIFARCAVLTGLLACSAFAAPSAAQVVVPGGFRNGLYVPSYYGWYPWNNWYGLNPWLSPIAPAYTPPAPQTTVVVAPTVKETQPAPPQAPPPPAPPSLPLSAPTNVIRWTGVGRFPILRTTIGLDGRHSVALEVNGQEQTFTLGDTFSAANVTYRVTGIAIDGVTLVAQQSLTLR